MADEKNGFGEIDARVCAGGGEGAEFLQWGDVWGGSGSGVNSYFETVGGDSGRDGLRVGLVLMFARELLAKEKTSEEQDDGSKQAKESGRFHRMGKSVPWF